MNKDFFNKVFNFVKKIFLYKLNRDKKKRAHKESIFDYLIKSEASNIEMELLEHVLTTLTESN